MVSGSLMDSMAPHKVIQKENTEPGPKNGPLRVVQTKAIFEVNVGKRWIRHRTILNLNDAIFNRFGIDLEIYHSTCRSISDPTLSVIDFKNKMA